MFGKRHRTTPSRTPGLECTDSDMMPWTKVQSGRVSGLRTKRLGQTSSWQELAACKTSPGARPTTLLETCYARVPRGLLGQSLTSGKQMALIPGKKRRLRSTNLCAGCRARSSSKGCVAVISTGALNDARDLTFYDMGVRVLQSAPNVARER